MFGIGTGELLLILVIAVLVVGPERMIEFAGQLGKWLAQFRQTTESVTKDFREAFSLEAEEDAKEETRASAPSGESATSQQTSTSGLVEAPRESVEQAGTAVYGDVEPKPSPTLADGETEPVEETPEDEIGREAEPVIVEIAELVPEDQDVEPVALDQPILVEEGVTEDAADSEG